MKKPDAWTALLGKFFPFRFIVAKLTNVPFLRPILTRLLFHQTNLTYLPKDTIVTIPINTSIHPVDSMVLPSQVVEQFIRNASHRFLMDVCLCRQSNHCQHHPVELGCLFLGDAVKDIKPQYGHEINITEALDHVEKCRKAGLIHLIGRDHIDKTWLQVKDGSKLMTICNCCECCCLWKWTPDLHPQIRSKIQRMPGVSLIVDKNCVGCGACIDHCFMHAIELKNKKAVITEECKGCGRCVEHCPSHAIHLKINDEHYLEKTVERIESAVDVS